VVARVARSVGLVTGGVYVHKKHKRERLDRALIDEQLVQRSFALPYELAAAADVSKSTFFPITPAPTQLLGKDGVGHFKSREGVVVCADRARAVSSGAHNDQRQCSRGVIRHAEPGVRRESGCLNVVKRSGHDRTQIVEFRLPGRRRVTVLLASSLAQLFFIAQYPELRAGQRPA